jgi:molybdopterin-guanine dinucleotide biosynthesis protein A
MTLTSLLMAGGESRRMGADKAILPWAGEPLWSHQLRLLRELKPDALWISAKTRPAWCPDNVGSVLDRKPSRGPLSGIAAALLQLKTSHLLALAIDMPHMTAEHINKLRGLLGPQFGVIPTDQARFQPLCAIYPAEAAAVADETLAGGDTSLQQFSRMLVTRQLAQPYPIPAADLRLYGNMNTPDALSRTASQD